SLEEVVMGIRTRPTQFPELASGVQTEQITAASRLVSYLTGFAVQPNKAIVSGNAFAHESGIHQDGVIKNPLTYEIMTPQSIGLTGSGPVDALYSAVDQALHDRLGWHPVLTHWEIKAVSAGEDAQGQVLVRCRRSSDEGQDPLVVSGHGLSTNIIEASLDGYLVAVNKLHGAEIN